MKHYNNYHEKNYDTYLFIGVDTKNEDCEVEFYGDESDLIANIGELICYAVEQEGVSVDKILEVYI